MDTSRVTRFEVIGPDGRELTRLGVHVTLVLQDDNRTLKVFLSDRPEPFEYDRKGWVEDDSVLY